MKSILLTITLLSLLTNCKQFDNSEKKAQKDSTENIYKKTIQYSHEYDSLQRLRWMKRANSFNEKELDNNCVETYRFFWYRSFHPDMIITIYNREEKFTLLIKTITDNKTISSHNKNLTLQQWQAFKKEIDGAYFWELGPQDLNDSYNIGFDGASWALEGRRGYDNLGNTLYHQVLRLNPKEGNFKNACKKLIEFSQLIPSNEIY